jgi:phosphatidylglycerophosphate synthase
MKAPSRRLQVLIKAAESAPSVAGLPCAVRSVFRAGRELSPERIVVIGADAAFLQRWSFQFQSSGAAVVSDRFGAEALDPRLPVLALDEDAFPDEGGLTDFFVSAEALGAAKRVVDGRVVAAYAREGAQWGAGRSAPDDVRARVLFAPAELSSRGAFFDAATPQRRAEAETALFARLAKANDGYLARFDRKLSLALTRLMLPFAITPNMVTGASLVLGLVGAWGLAAASAREQFVGAMVLWFCALLDGCDGEIARLKLHMTEFGGDFDLWADHLAHLATFVALPIGVARLNPGENWWIPGVMLVTGFLACGFSVWWLVLRLPEDKRGALSLAVERIASRDYVYLILALTSVGHLEWFVWAAALGSHVFWAWLWWAARLRPAEA